MSSLKAFVLPATCSLKTKSSPFRGLKRVGEASVLLVVESTSVVLERLHSFDGDALRERDRGV